MHKDSLIDAIAENGGLSRDDAGRVFDLYKRHHLIRFTASGGFSVAHGAALDGETIAGALATLNGGPDA